MASIMKIMMSMALLVIGVNAMSIDECKRTTGCQNQCDLFYRSVACGDCLLQCAYPLSIQTLLFSNTNLLSYQH